MVYPHDCIMAETHIRSFPIIYKTPAPKNHFLPSSTERQTLPRSFPKIKIKEPLIQVKPVLVHCSGSPCPSIFYPAHELNKKAYTLANMKVTMNQISLQVISIIILSTFSPIIIVYRLKMLASFPTQGQIEGLGFIEWNIFYRVKKICLLSRIF